MSKRVFLNSINDDKENLSAVTNKRGKFLATTLALGEAKINEIVISTSSHGLIKKQHQDLLKASPSYSKTAAPLQTEQDEAEDLYHEAENYQLNLIHKLLLQAPKLLESNSSEAQTMPTNPMLYILNIGHVTIPLNVYQAEEILNVYSQVNLNDKIQEDICQIKMPYFEITNLEWDTKLAQVIHKAICDMGINHGERKLVAIIERILILKPGQIMKRQRYVSNEPNSFGTLFLQPPSEHVGGEITVYDDVSKKQFSMGVDTGASRLFAQYLLFSSKYEYSAAASRERHRLLLAYSLSWIDAEKSDLEENQADEVINKCATTLDILSDSSHRLALFLENSYSPFNFTNNQVDALLGVDKNRYALLKNANDRLSEHKKYEFSIAHAHFMVKSVISSEPIYLVNGKIREAREAKKRLMEEKSENTMEDEEKEETEESTEKEQPPKPPNANGSLENEIHQYSISIEKFFDIQDSDFSKPSNGLFFNNQNLTRYRPPVSYNIGVFSRFYLPDYINEAVEKESLYHEALWGQDVRDNGRQYERDGEIVSKVTYSKFILCMWPKSKKFDMMLSLDRELAIEFLHSEVVKKAATVDYEALRSAEKLVDELIASGEIPHKQILNYCKNLELILKYIQYGFVNRGDMFVPYNELCNMILTFDWETVKPGLFQSGVLVSNTLHRMNNNCQVIKKLLTLKHEIIAHAFFSDTILTYFFGTDDLSIVIRKHYASLDPITDELQYRLAETKDTAVINLAINMTDALLRFNYENKEFCMHKLKNMVIRLLKPIDMKEYLEHIMYDYDQYSTCPIISVILNYRLNWLKDKTKECPYFSWTMPNAYIPNHKVFTAFLRSDHQKMTYEDVFGGIGAARKFVNHYEGLHQTYSVTMIAEGLRKSAHVKIEKTTEYYYQHVLGKYNQMIEEMRKICEYIN